VFVTGEYNWGVQPGLKNLTDHFLEEWAKRPVALASYSAGRYAGVRSCVAWHSILAEMGLAVVPNTLSVGSIADTLTDQGDEVGEGGKALKHSWPRFVDELLWWTEAAYNRRLKG
jgi:NAD(P)H-dependent FMN reductase